MFCLLLFIFELKKNEMSTTIFVFLIFLWETSHPTVLDFFWKTKIQININLIVMSKN